MSLDSEQALPSCHDGEATSHQVLAAGRLQPPAGARQAGAGRVLTTGSGSAYLTQGGFQPLPPQVASVSHALAAEISS